MQKLLFASLITLCAMASSSHAIGQIYYEVNFGYMWSQNSVSVTTTNVGITTTQTTAGSSQSNTTTAPGGYYTDPLGIFTYGYYYSTPSLFNQMTIQVLSGYTATVQNTSSTAYTVRMAVSIYQANGNAIYFYGPYATVPGNGTATLSIPAAAYTYTAPLPADATPPGSAYSVPVTIWLSNS